MKTYLLTLYYPSLKSAQESVRQCHDAVKRVAGNNWKLLRAGGNAVSIAFATDLESRRIQGFFTDAGRQDFQFLIVEISSVVAGYIDRTTYEWIEGRLARD